MQNIEALYQQLADAIADVIEHPACPQSLYDALSQWTADFESDMTPALSVADEAAAIRATFPRLCQIAHKKSEGQEVR